MTLACGCKVFCGVPGCDAGEWSVPYRAELERTLNREIQMHATRDELVATRRLLWAMCNKYGCEGVVTITHADQCGIKFAPADSLEVEKLDNGDIALKAKREEKSQSMHDGHLLRSMVNSTFGTD